MEKGISVIICCYNSAARLPETLKCLALQEGLTGIPWEVIIVNNNSTDQTPVVAAAEWEKYGINVPLKILDEPQPGLSAAREKGISGSRFEYLLFCDDDNSLFPDYLHKVWEHFSRDQSIGLIGGQGIAVCENTKPVWFDSVQIMYAVGPQHEHSGDITSTGKALYGAGMGIRKQVFNHLKSKGFEFVLSDRKGASLSSGGDTELCFASVILGYKLYYDADLKFYHMIPAGRLNESYLAKLSAAMVESTTLLKPYVYYAFRTKEMNIKPLWAYEIAKTAYEYILGIKANPGKGIGKINGYLKRIYFLIKINKDYDAILTRIKTIFSVP